MPCLKAEHLGQVCQSLINLTQDKWEFWFHFWYLYSCLCSHTMSRRQVILSWYITKFSEVTFKEMCWDSKEKVYDRRILLGYVKNEWVFPMRLWCVPFLNSQSSQKTVNLVFAHMTWCCQTLLQYMAGYFLVHGMLVWTMWRMTQWTSCFTQQR